MEEWLPVLDGNVKHSIPEVREYLDGRKLYLFDYDPGPESSELSSGSYQELFRSTTILYLYDPMMGGLRNYIHKYNVHDGCLDTEGKKCKPDVEFSCVDYFDSVRDGLLIRALERQKSRREQ